MPKYKRADQRSQTARICSVTRSWSPTVARAHAPIDGAMAHGHVPQLACGRRSAPMKQNSGDAAHQPLAFSTAMAAGHGAGRAQAHLARPDEAGCARVRRGRLHRRLTAGLGDAPDVRAIRPGRGGPADADEGRVAAGDQADSGAAHQAGDVQVDQPRPVHRAPTLPGHSALVPACRPRQPCASSPGHLDRSGREVLDDRVAGA
jgi:hypothetical protein